MLKLRVSKLHQDWHQRLGFSVRARPFRSRSIFFRVLLLTHLTFGDGLRGKQDLNLKCAHEHSSELMILSSRCYSGEASSFFFKKQLQFGSTSRGAETTKLHNDLLSIAVVSLNSSTLSTHCVVGISTQLQQPLKRARRPSRNAVLRPF
jgi:hypothetical protein